MDSAWAVVVGSAIGAFGAIAGTTFGGYLSDRRRARSAHDDALRSALEVAMLQLIEHTGHVNRSDQSATYESGEKFLAAAAKLGMLLRKGEAQIDTIIVGTFAAINLDPQHGTAYASSVAQLLPAWYRGDITIAELTTVKRAWPKQLLDSERGQGFEIP
jgi:hypothetical protein